MLAKWQLQALREARARTSVVTTFRASFYRATLCDAAAAYSHDLFSHPALPHHSLHCFFPPNTSGAYQYRIHLDFTRETRLAYLNLEKRQSEINTHEKSTLFSGIDK
ncbi:hypothetical protein OUZ56_000516 [Daphnia magna]|uniref:Uncharacterized protein n=1 Tax=Daphnia magna TaxID=35525 RepID=A0ABQ9ZZX3_9CRUS|nr:hypothetical protein OUZ56_000516 [Daphnia magna]